MAFRLFALIYGCAAVLLAGSSKKSPDLEKLAPGDTVQVIVQYRSLPGLDQLNRLGARGGKILNTLTAVAGVTVSIPPGALDALAADPAVTYISLDRPVFGAMNYSVPTVGADIALSYGLDGKGVTVAIIDSGIAHHADHAGSDQADSRVAYSESFVPGALGKSTIDRYGHGFGEHRKIAKDLEGADPQKTVDVIAQFKQLVGSNAPWGTTTQTTVESANLLVQDEK
jgi:hypothetical protein